MYPLLTGQWYARETTRLLDVHDVTNSMIRAKDDGIADESLFKLLYLEYLISLEFHATVVMDDSWGEE